MVQVAVDDLDGEVLPAMGEVDDAVWTAVSGGQPVALTRGGRVAAIVVDPETYAEMVCATRTPEGTS